MEWLPIIILGGVVLAGLLVVGYVRSRIRRLSNSLFGTDSLIDGFKQQQSELSQTPKSVSSMTRIFLPQIQKDFPEFNYEEFKTKAENMLISSLMAISSSDMSYLDEASEDLRESVRLRIENNHQQCQTEHYSGIKIHQTEITNYKKQAGTCVITLQSAVEHMHYIERNGKIISGSTAYREQCNYMIDIVYIQDAGRLS